GVAALLVRYALRRRLHRERRQGRQMRSVLAVGSPEAVRELVAHTRRAPECGWHITAACTPPGLDRPGQQIGTPVVGDLDAVARVAIEGGFGIVAVSPAAGWTPKRLQQLSWDLEGSGAELVVDPGLMEIAGPRLHMTPVDGLQLLRLTNPRFTGLPGAFKGIADRVAAVAAITLLAPVFLVIAMAVRLDGGPAFFVQTRVGRGGKAFRMVKFRSMVVDAEAHLAALQASNQGAGPLFKMRRDPRVTRVGAVLRRYSLDELPQLFNVLLGTMSIVGPRPPLAGEVSGYEREALRKLMVKPGITGLWQVSGRSELSWEDSVRLDLRYVENWSPAMDLAIVWKTVRAMVRGTGAY
nr:sugar transferase [Pseudonocardiales bacterium]